MTVCYHCLDEIPEGRIHWHAAKAFCYLCAYKRGYVNSEGVADDD